MRHMLLVANLAVAVFPVFADVRDDIATTEKSIAALMTATKALAEPLMVKDADLMVFVSLAPLIAAAARIAAQPPEKRRVTFQSTAANGKFWENGADWCGSYVELARPDAMTVTGVLDEFFASIEPDGSLMLKPVLSIRGNAHMHLHFFGPRVPIRVMGVRVGNACVLKDSRGDFGWEQGVAFSKRQDLAVKVTLTQGSSNTVDYAAQIVSPAKMSITLEIGFKHIGALGQPVSLDLPQAPLAKGSFPLLFQTSGEFKLPGSAGRRSYELKLEPVHFMTSKVGIQARWKSAVRFGAAPP